MIERDYLFLPGRPIHAIIAEVGQKYGLTYSEMIAKRRQLYLVGPRHEAIWRCAMETTASLPEIGRAFHRDHTTVLHAIRAHEVRNGIASDEMKAKHAERLKSCGLRSAHSKMVRASNAQAAQEI